MSDHASAWFAAVCVVMLALLGLAANDDRPPNDPTGVCMRPQPYEGC